MLPIPETCLPALAGLDLSTYTPLQSRMEVFTQYDREHPGGDPTNCRFLGKLADGVVVWSAKLAIDADGIAKTPAGRCGSDLDPDSGQNDTSLHISGRALSSELHPYYVLPLGLFRQQTGLALGDLCAVIYRGCVAGAVFGDLGPWDKLGEGSIRLHEALARGGAPDPCRKRDAKGRCELIRNVSIAGDVVVVGFPGSRVELEWGTAEEEIGRAVAERLGGVGVA